jgi:hypothetical protein
MADSKISVLNSLNASTVAIGDALPIVDSDASETKQIAIFELVTYAADIFLINQETIAATDASYTPSTTFAMITLDDDGDDTDIAVTMASALSTSAIYVFFADDGGSTGHTITLGGSQTWDGTNNIATFDTAGDCLVVAVRSSTRVNVIANNGVTFSS